MTIQFANNASTTLASGITDSDLSLTVATGEGSLFPSPTGGDYFLATIVAANGSLEIVKCTARSNDIFTIERGQESTTPLAFSAGATVDNRPTAGSFESILTAVGTIDGFPTPENDKFIGEYDSGSGTYPAYTASEMLTALGAGTIGAALFANTTASAARSTIGSGTTGDALFIAADAATALTALGTGTAALVDTGTDSIDVPLNSDLGTAAYLDVGTSANNIVQLNGSAQLPAVDGSNLTGINAGEWALVSSATPSGSASVEFTGLTGRSYEYRVSIVDMTSSSETALYVTLGYGATPTYITSYKGWRGEEKSGASFAAPSAKIWTATNSTELAITGSVGGLTTKHFMGDIQLNDTSANAGPSVDWKIKAIHDDSALGYLAIYTGIGMGVTTSEITAIKLTMGAGTITGKVKLYRREV